MKKYIQLIETFVRFAGFSISHIKHGDTDLVQLEPGDELLVIFSPTGSDDIFIIFEEAKAVITFGQWAQEISGGTLEDFEHLLDLIRGILDGDYIVRDVRTDQAEVALLTCESTSQVVSSFIQEGEDYLESVSAKAFFEGLSGKNAAFEISSWTDFDDQDEELDWDSQEDRNSDLEYKYSENYLENKNNIQNESDEDCSNEHTCSCGHHHH
ncbi:MAG: hypothetical protein HUJ55_05205 [Ileibacterium sp.]|nr:hypothetical protein [Ileibacterium sp.]